MDLIINNYEYPAINDANTLKQILLELIDIEYSPLQTLKANMNSLFDLIETFCKIRKEKAKGSEKAKFTREINKINSQKEYWLEIKNREDFVKKYYEYILSLEGLRPLNRFSFI